MKTLIKEEVFAEIAKQRAIKDFKLACSEAGGGSWDSLRHLPLEEVVDTVARNGVSFIYKAANTSQFATPMIGEVLDAANRINSDGHLPNPPKPGLGLALPTATTQGNKAYEYEITHTEIYKVFMDVKMSIDEKMDIEDGWKFPAKVAPEIRFVETRVEVVS